jgi:NAD(P)-dependent dehydrogenase (short-subunit alcohol dehydrogenase family)
MDVSVSKRPTPQPFAPGMLRGKAAVVTGSTSGIGLGIARALAAQGADVLLNGFGRAEVIENVRSSLADAHGVRVSYSAADMSKPDEIDGMIAQATRDLGGVDILVNNAAIMRDLPQYGLSNMPVEEWDRVMDVNLRGPLLCTQAVLPSMLERGGGRIINGSSAGAFSAGGIYGISKYALHSLTANLASELGPQGINVNAIAPGLVAAESGYVSLPADSPIRAALESGIPGKKSGPPEDLIGTLLLLCSSAGDWINGQTISVDGGWVMRL